MSIRWPTLVIGIALVSCGTPTVVASVSPLSGGKVSSLMFAVVGDTRPPNEDDVANYPTAIANGIYHALAGLSPGPQFVISTGDYMYSSTDSGATASQQMALYQQASSQVTVPRWPAMGNHECTGATASNCPGYNETPNMKAFMSSMMAPLGETTPYYVRNVSATDGSWTAKFVFVAPNAWSSTQQSWLESTLSTATTYTFIVKHERSDVTETPGIPAIASIVSAHPVTLGIVGHTHSWEWHVSEVVIGNGGAPITGNVPYGYTLFQQQSDGAIVITAYDYTTGKSFETHTVTSTGVQIN